MQQFVRWHLHQDRKNRILGKNITGKNGTGNNGTNKKVCEMTH